MPLVGMSLSTSPLRVLRACAAVVCDRIGRQHAVLPVCLTAPPALTLWGGEGCRHTSWKAVTARSARPTCATAQVLKRHTRWGQSSRHGVACRGCCAHAPFSPSSACSRSAARSHQAPPAHAHPRTPRIAAAWGREGVWTAGAPTLTCSSSTATTSRHCLFLHLFAMSRAVSPRCNHRPAGGERSDVGWWGLAVGKALVGGDLSTRSRSALPSLSDGDHAGQAGGRAIVAAMRPMWQSSDIDIDIDSDSDGHS